MGMKSLDDINDIEQAFSVSAKPNAAVTGGLMPAVALYEGRYFRGASDKETVLRLLFLYWYALAEPPYITGLDGVSEPALRFTQLFEKAEPKYQHDAEFCWILGYLLSLDPFFFGNEEKWRDKSKALLARAFQLEPTDPIIQLVRTKALNAVHSVSDGSTSERVQLLLSARFTNRGYMGIYLMQALDRK